MIDLRLYESPARERWTAAARLGYVVARIEHVCAEFDDAYHRACSALEALGALHPTTIAALAETASAKIDLDVLVRLYRRVTRAYETLWHTRLATT